MGPWGPQLLVLAVCTYLLGGEAVEVHDDGAQRVAVRTDQHVLARLQQRLHLHTQAHQPCHPTPQRQGKQGSYVLREKPCFKATPNPGLRV